MARTPKSPANAPAPVEAPAAKATAPAAPAKAKKPVAQPAMKKAAAKPASAKKAPAKKATTPKPAAADKAAKAKKPKLVRDSFTIPKAEYDVLDKLKHQAAALGHPAKKSEVLRAGILALSALSETALLAALAKVPAIKTGRPKKD